MSGSGVDRLPSWKFGPPCGWLILIVLAGALACADRDAIEHKRPPNIVIVVADDIGVDLVGAYARFYPPTPAPNTPYTPTIDRLASEGLLFRNAWTNPGCSPTRSQILTGLHASRTGIGGNVSFTDFAKPAKKPGLAFGYTLLPQVLKSIPTPYDTAAVGKWHLASPIQGPMHALGPSGAWFDRWAGSRFNLGGNDSGYRKWRKTYATSIRHEGGHACGPPYPCSKIVSESKSCEQYATVDTIDDAVHLVGTMTEPFLLYVAFNAAHGPLDLPNCVLPGSCSEGPLEPVAPVTKPERTRAMVRTLDHQLGRLLCAIDDSDTVVIFIGDNGTAGDTRWGTPSGIVPPFPGKHGKGTAYQGGLNVPLIVRGPGVEPGISDALVGSTDILATVAELAGHSDPNGLTRDSISWVPYHLNDQRTSLRATVVGEIFTPIYTPVDVATGEPPKGYRSYHHRRAIRNDRFKLVEWYFNGQFTRDEFFDLLRGGPVGPNGAPTRDDFEQNDLIGSRADWPADGDIERNHRALKAELATTLPLLP